MRVAKDVCCKSVIRKNHVQEGEAGRSIHINPNLLIPSSSILFARETSGKLLVCDLSKSIQPDLLGRHFFSLLAIWHLI